MKIRVCSNESCLNFNRLMPEHYGLTIKCEKCNRMLPPIPDRK